MNNVVPSGWKLYELKDVALKTDRYSFTGGPFGSNLKSEDYTDYGVRIIQLQNIGDGEFKNKYKIFTSPEKADELSSCNIFPNDIILSKMGDPVARATIIPSFDNRYVMASDGIRLAVDKSRFDTKFIHDTINAQAFRGQAELSSTGSTRKRIGLTELRSLTLVAPPLPEQKKIATIMSSVDDVIEKTREQIDKLKDLKTGMMQELLTKGIGHTEFKDSPVGRIPKGWDVGTLDSFGVSVLDGDRGKEYPKEKDFHSFEYCLFLSAKNVTKKGFVFSELSFITKEKDELLRKGKLTRGDIVITTRGTVGNIAFYDNEVAFNNIRINSGMAIIRNSSTVLDSQFLHLLMNSPMVGEQVDLLAFGSAQPQLTIGIIKNLDVPKPSLEEQKAITSAVTAMTTKLQLVNKKLNLLLSTKKALMQDLLTGKVRVNLNESTVI